ncbi:hypothetical protein GCM10020295_44860 [Streptomyces cinereospinus]
MCHGTACRRTGSERNARVAGDCPAACTARTSAPRPRVSVPDTARVFARVLRAVRGARGPEYAVRACPVLGGPAGLRGEHREAVPR